MNLKEILKAASVKYRISGESGHATEGWIQIDCPFCFPNSKPNKFHMGVNPRSRAAHCWKCGKHSIFQVLGLVLKKDRRFIWNLLGQKETKQYKQTYARKEFQLPGTITKNSPIVLEYLSSRWGKTRAGEIAERFDLGFFRKSWRIYIPVKNQACELVSWTMRAIGNVEPRFISASKESEIEPHKNLLYGEWLIGESDTVVVCEGPSDVWNLQPLLPAVATFGVSYSQSQLQALLKYDRVVLCLDPDKPGRDASRRLADSLVGLDPTIKVFCVDLQKGDAGEMSRNRQEQIAFCFRKKPGARSIVK